MTNGSVWNGIVEDEVRPGWALKCPGCALWFRYTTLDDCPSGSRFSLGASAKCPHCGYELKFGGDDEGRLYQTSITWVEGATAYRGSEVPSNRLTRVIA